MGKELNKQIYNKIVDEISDMVWTNHYSLICEVMNKFGDKINEEDYDDIQEQMTEEIDNLLKRK
tara:strand:- start:281 stop:472 length:192 start_codon:yes stop_codon:yes gene_type:complete